MLTEPDNLNHRALMLSRMRSDQGNFIDVPPMRLDMIWEANGISHRLTVPNHLWAIGPVERVNCTIAEATVSPFRSDNCQQLCPHLAELIEAYKITRS